MPTLYKGQINDRLETMERKLRNFSKNIIAFYVHDTAASAV